MIVESDGYTRKCRRCQQQVPVQDMETRNCRACMEAWREYLSQTKYRLKEYQRAHHLMQTYGLTVAEFDSMLEQQDNRCYICRSTEFDPRHRRPHVDHNHKTGQIRGLLCTYCNAALGMFKEDIEILRQAVEYLEHFNKVASFNVRELMR